MEDQVALVNTWFMSLKKIQGLHLSSGYRLVSLTRQKSIRVQLSELRDSFMRDSIALL